MYDLKEVMEPLWKEGTIKRESVIFLEENDFQSELLFGINKIIKLESSDQKTVYTEDEDYFIKDGKIVLTEKSSVPKLFSSQLYPEKYQEGKVFGCTRGGYLSFSEGTYWHKLQTYVTYETKGSINDIPLPAKSELLPKTLKKLSCGETIRLVVYGDSISEGYNASGFVGEEPYMPSYGQLTAEFAVSKGASVWLKNTSLAGKDTVWALENVKERVIQYSPDLVILAFGMNDGTSRISGEDFRKNMETLRNEVLKSNPDCEFIMIAPTLPNKMACLLDEEKTPFYGTQDEYADEIVKLKQQGTDILDMTAIHRSLLRKKKFTDMTGNNVNHPNDYLVRWYAQCLCIMLGLMK